MFKVCPRCEGEWELIQNSAEKSMNSYYSCACGMRAIPSKSFCAFKFDDLCISGVGWEYTGECVATCLSADRTDRIAEKPIPHIDVKASAEELRAHFNKHTT